MTFPHRKLNFSIIALVSLVQLISIQGESELSMATVERDLKVKVINQEDDSERAESCASSTRNENDKLILADVKNSEIKINSTLSESVTPNVTKVNCLTDKVYGPVEIVNATRLTELLVLEPGPSNRSRSTKEGKQIPGTCVLVLFYARWCVFSSQAAPHFNALPRFFPHLKVVAIDAIKYQSFNTQYGIVCVPTLMLAHNGKPVAKFNDTEYTLGSFASFITYFTTLQPNASLYVTSADFSGPVSSTPSNETDYCLVLSWMFIVMCSLYFTSHSRWWRQFVELIQNTWRESNAQHEHTD